MHAGPPATSSIQQRMCCASHVEESQRGHGIWGICCNHKSLSISWGEPLKWKCKEPRFGFDRTSCVHNPGLDLRSALPTQHNHSATANTKSSYKLWNMEVVSKYFRLLFYLQFTGRPMNCVWMKHSWVWIRQNPRKYPKYKSKSLFTPKRRKLHILYHNVQIRVLTSKAQTWRAVIWNRLFKQDMQWKNIKRQKKPPGKMDHNTFPFSFCLILKMIIPCKCTLDRPTRKLAFFMLH